MIWHPAVLLTRAWDNMAPGLARRLDGIVPPATLLIGEPPQLQAASTKEHRCVKSPMRFHVGPPEGAQPGGARPADGGAHGLGVIGRKEKQHCARCA